MTWQRISDIRWEDIVNHTFAAPDRWVPSVPSGQWASRSDCTNVIWPAAWTLKWTSCCYPLFTARCTHQCFAGYQFYGLLHCLETYSWWTQYIRCLLLWPFVEHTQALYYIGHTRRFSRYRHLLWSVNLSLNPHGSQSTAVRGMLKPIGHVCGGSLVSALSQPVPVDWHPSDWCCRSACVPHHALCVVAVGILHTGGRLALQWHGTAVGHRCGIAFWGVDWSP